MASCPLLTNKTVAKEFGKLTELFGEDMAYYLWDKNGGYYLDKASNGETSILFNKLESAYGEDEALKKKANTLTNKFNEVFKGYSKDENDEYFYEDFFVKAAVTEVKEPIVNTEEVGESVTLDEGNTKKLNRVKQIFSKLPLTVVFDSNMNLLRYSSLFKLSTSSSE
jgi:hypothetical protein